MLSFKPQELEKILRFIIHGGYVFDLNNKRFNEFTKRSIGVEVQSKYASEGLSKGKALTRFLNNDAADEQAVRLLSDLLEYYELNIRETGQPDDISRSSEDARFAKILVKSYEIVLKERRNTKNPMMRFFDGCSESESKQKLFPHGWAMCEHQSEILRVYYDANFAIHEFVKEGSAIPDDLNPCLVAIDAVAGIVNIDANLDFYIGKTKELWRPAYTFFSSEEMFRKLEDFIEKLPKRYAEKFTCDYAGEMHNCVTAFLGLVDALCVADRNIRRTQAIVAVKAFGNEFRKFLENPNDDNYAANYENLIAAEERMKDQFTRIADEVKVSELSVAGVVVHDEYHPKMKLSLDRMYEHVFVGDMAQVWAKDRDSLRGIKKSEKVNDTRPATAEDAIAAFTESEERRKREKLDKLKALLTANMPILAMSSPTFMKIFTAIRDTLCKGTESMKRGSVEKLHPIQCWPNLLPEVLSPVPTTTVFWTLGEQDDDPFTEEVELQSGRKVYIANARQHTEEDDVLDEIKKRLSEFIQAGLELAGKIKSASYDKWAEATALWDECDNCCSLNQTRPHLDSLRDAIIAALRRLSVDVKVAAADAAQAHGADKDSRKRTNLEANTAPSRCNDEPLSEFALELKIAPPFDMMPIVNGEVSVLDAEIQQKILKHVKGTVLIASCKVVVPEVLLFHNYGVKWLCTSVVCDPGRQCDASAISRWQSAHTELMHELLRYCEEQARNALAIGADESARLWIRAKSNLSLTSALHFIGEEAHCDILRNNQTLYDDALNDAVQASTLHDQALQLAELRGDNVGEKISVHRDAWFKQKEMVDDNPFTRKFVAWGAESTEKIPSWCLTVKDGIINKEVFERNLRVVGRDYSDLYEQLNANVKKFMQSKAAELRRCLDECMTGALYQGKLPVRVLMGKLDEVAKGLETGEYYRNGDNWGRLLAVALGLPRYCLRYFDWARIHEDEGPTEPGLFFDTADGNRYEVHYDVDHSEWWQDMDNVDYQVTNLIRVCNDVAPQLGKDAVVDEWIEIERRWNECRGSVETGAFYHCVGDLNGFAECFYRGVNRILIVLSKWNRGPSERQDDGANKQNEGMGENAKAPSDAVVEKLVPLLEDIRQQGENTNRNVLRVLKEEKQVRANTVHLLDVQGETEKMTAHDNGPTYRSRATGSDLQMLKDAAELVKKGINRSNAAENIYGRRAQYKGQTFSSVETFKTQVYRYCDGMGIAPKK